MLRVAMGAVLLAAGLSLLSLVVALRAAHAWPWDAQLAPFQAVSYLGLATTLWPLAFRRFRRGFQLLHSPRHAVPPLLQATALDIAALYLSGFALVVVYLLVRGTFPWDVFHPLEAAGLLLLGAGLLGWGAQRLNQALRPSG